MKLWRIIGSIVDAVAPRRADTRVTGPDGEAIPPQTGEYSGLVDTATANNGDNPALNQDPAAWLLFQSGYRAGESVQLDAPSVSIGRSTENDLVIEDAAMSRIHARIYREDGQYYIEDLRSMSGTLVDGSSVTKTLLTSGGSLKLGETEVVFMQAEPSSVPGNTSGPMSSSQSPAETMVMQQTQGLMAWLAITAGPQKGKTYQIKDGDNTIGRDPDSDLALEDQGVSRSHAMIKAQDGVFLLMDLGSRGGTRMEGKALKSRALKPGGVIGVGQTQLKLVDVKHEEAAERPSTAGETMIDQPSPGTGVLVVQTGPDAGKSFPVAQGDNVIGRDPDCAVYLNDPTVSRKHTMIRCEQDRTVVYDLGSRTGTQVDGDTLVGYYLAPGYTISLGHTEMVLMTPQNQQG